MALGSGLYNERRYMNRKAGLAVLLGLVAAACSESPTAPVEAKVDSNHPPIANSVAGAEAKAAWYRARGGFPQHPSFASTMGLQSVLAPPPFWNTPFGASTGAGDDTCKFVNFGFVFTFYGKPYTGAWIGSNGYILFAPNDVEEGCPFTNYYNTFLNNNEEGNGSYPMVAGLWTDWYPPGAGAVDFKLVGLPPLRRLVATWVGVPEYFSSSPNSTFQIQLLEFLNTIVLSYNGLSVNGFHDGTPMAAGIASGSFTGYGAGYGGLPSVKVVAAGAQIPALDGHTTCLVNLGTGYIRYDTICSIFVH
jgi:hypothetical protein